MATETFAELWRQPRLWVPSADIGLCQQLIKARFRDIVRKKMWSWRMAEGQFTVPNAYSTGTVSVTFGSRTVLGSGTAWTSSLVGRQFRVGAVAPVYTIVAVDNAAQSLTLDMEWGGNTASGIGYVIFLAYITPPDDFHDWLSIRNVAYNWQLRLHVSQTWLNSVDAQRASSGTSYCVADFRYGSSPSGGSVGRATRVVGSGDAPVASGVYTGRTASLFVVTVTNGGATGTAEFSWRKDNGTTNSGIVTDAAAIEMQEGVMIQWPAGLIFVLNDVFVISVTPGLVTNLPQYELWPYQFSQQVYPFLYVKQEPDLDEANGALPRYIQGDVLVKGALADLYRWPGTKDQPNPAFSLPTSASFENEFQAKVAEMERDDEEIYQQMMTYWSDLSYAPYPFMDARWMQSHDVY